VIILVRHGRTELRLDVPQDKVFVLAMGRIVETAEVRHAD